MHWAEVVAIDLLKKGNEHIVNTGISPSGYIHVGNMREILTGDAIHRAIIKNGGKSVLNYIADSFDPLRKDIYSLHLWQLYFSL